MLCNALNLCRPAEQAIDAIHFEAPIHFIEINP